MTKELAILVTVCNAFLMAWSQLLLKKSAMRIYDKKYQVYLNKQVIVSYIVLFGATIVSMYVMLYLPYKSVSITGTLSYVFVVLLSIVFLKEKIVFKKMLGMALILLGILIFNL